MSILSNLFAAFSVLSLGVPAFAQGGEAAGGTNWVAIAAGFSMAFASGICALAQGKATAAAAEGLARKPCGPSRNPDRLDSWIGAHRIPCALHLRYYLHQGEIGFQK